MSISHWLPIRMLLTIRSLKLNLDELEPLAACPSSPDNIRPVKELQNIEVKPGSDRQLHQQQLSGLDDCGHDAEGSNRAP